MEKPDNLGSIPSRPVYTKRGGEMKIRKAIDKDIVRINEIVKSGIYQEASLQHLGNKKKVKEDVEFDFNFHKKTIGKNLKDKKQYWVVVEEKGDIVGVGGAYIKGKERGIIESIYIAKKFQRKGYGKAIIENLINWIKSTKVRHIESNAFVRNKPSIKLHEKLGFKPYILRVRLK